MNTPTIVALALITGLIVGMGLAAYMFHASPPDDNQAAENDTKLLDYLEASHCNLFFNEQVHGGMWGFLRADNKPLATGRTVRNAIFNARSLANAAGLANALKESA